MKKVLAFLMLFGAGLLALWWFERPSKDAKAGEDPVVAPIPAPEARTPVPGIELRGRFEGTFYDQESRRTLIAVKSEDSRTRADGDELDNVHLELFDPGSGELQSELDASQAAIKRLGSTDELRPVYENRIGLEEVRARFLTGTLFSPLELTAPEAVLDATDKANRHVRTGGRFNATSEQLEASGRGLVFALDADTLRVEQEGLVRFRRAGGIEARLSSLERGALEVRSRGEVVELEAWDGARLETIGERPGSLAADHLVARALPTKDEGAEQPLAVESLDADGGVEWTAGENVFTGETATMFFDPGVRLRAARLATNPRAHFELVHALPAVPGVPEGLGSEIDLEGETLLEITWRDGGADGAPGYLLRTEGVSSVRSRDFRLLSAQGVNGFIADDDSGAEFGAAGGVEVETETGKLEAGEFRVAFATRAESSYLRGTASGGARLIGWLPDNRSYSLTTPDRLEVEAVQGGGWRILEGTSITVTLDNPDGFTAKADRLVNFDIEQFTFSAEGSIRFQNAAGEGGGERLVVRGENSFLLSGTETSRAFYRSPGRSASGLSIELVGEDSLRARGAVVAEGRLPEDENQELGSQSYRLETEELDLDRRIESTVRPGVERVVYTLAARGGVRGSFMRKGFRHILSAEELLVRRLQLQHGNRKDEPLEAQSRMTARGSVEGTLALQQGILDVRCGELSVEHEERASELVRQRVEAHDEVVFAGREDLTVSGRGERLVYENGEGFLSSDGGERVEMHGKLPSQEVPFRMTAREVTFGPGRVEASRPLLRFGSQRARAEHMLADAKHVTLGGNVRASGVTRSEVPWTMDADTIVFEGQVPVNQDEKADVRAVDAIGDVNFRLGPNMTARGSRLVAREFYGTMRLEGKPASLDSPLGLVEAVWVEFDPLLQIIVQTGPGRMVPKRELTVAPADGAFLLGGVLPVEAGLAQESEPPVEEAWDLQFLSTATLVEQDSLVFLIQEPVLRQPAEDSVVRASWASFWIDRQRWLDLPGENQDQVLMDKLRVDFEALRDSNIAGGPLGNMFDLFRSSQLSGLLKEVYFEGPVEFSSGGNLIARADAVYLDAVAGHGWLANATVNIQGRLVGRNSDQLIVKADWLRQSADGSLRANSATVTSCNFDEPHVKVVTGDLQIRPIIGKGPREQFRLTLDDNRIEMYNWLTIPLPALDIATDEELKPLWPTLSLGNTARLGSFLSLGIKRPADRAGEVFNDAVGGDKRDAFDANYSIDVSYLGSRGGLLDLGFDIESKERYWFDVQLGLVGDSGDDKGYIQVPDGDRDTLRRWVRSTGRFQNGRTFLDVAFSDQSDFGVQSEFFESDFVRYERDESYVQWHRASNEWYLQTTAKLQTESFRSDIEELPSVSIFRSRAPLFDVGGRPLIYSGEASVDYLRRREGGELGEDIDGDGNPDPLQSPFGLPSVFPDGQGEREVLRFDTRHQFEWPLAVGLAGLRLTPFAAARATFWDEGINPDQSPSRVIAEAGVRLATTFWNRREDGRVDLISPFVGYRSEVERKDEDGTPVLFTLDDRLGTADVVSFGARSRFGHDKGASSFDLDLQASYASNRSSGAADGWLPLGVFSRLDVDPFGRDVEFFWDGRFDLEERETTYSLFSAGTRFGERFGIQAGHQRGRSTAGVALFEAATVTAVYRWTEKWEFEVREAFSLLEGQELDLQIVVRRYGHDLVAEFEGQVREGEGSSLGISLRPRFGFDRRRIGYVPW